MVDYKSDYLAFMSKNKDNLPNGIYPDDEALEGLSEKEKFFFHYCDFGNDTMVKYLHNEGVNVNTRIIQGYYTDSTPLMWASLKGHYEVANYLIENGADINAKSSDGNSVIVWSVWNYGDIRILRMLIERGADINAMNVSERKTILTISIQNCNRDIAKYLIENGADIRKPNKMKSTGLYYAYQYKLEDIIDLLKKRGAK